MDWKKTLMIGSFAAGAILFLTGRRPAGLAVAGIGVATFAAEHPEKFTPSAGKITAFNPPGGTGVRIDTAAYAEGVIPPYYDSLIAKLVVRGKDRSEAISRMSRALEMFIVEGIFTTIPLHRKILADPEFRAGHTDTNFIERFFARIAKEKENVAG